VSDYREATPQFGDDNFDEVHAAHAAGLLMSPIKDFLADARI
jgi:hypothetical protein